MAAVSLRKTGARAQAAADSERRAIDARQDEAVGGPLFGVCLHAVVTAEKAVEFTDNGGPQVAFEVCRQRQVIADGVALVPLAAGDGAVAKGLLQ